MNTNLQSELKAYRVKGVTLGDTHDVYLKSDVDKVIADLEESHKKEVGQLLIEIAELKDKLRHYPMMAALIENGNKEINKLKDLNHALMADALRDRDRIRRQKYKRCFAMAEACMHKRWRTDEGFDYARSHRHMNKWLELAEKFKEDK